MPDVLTPKDKLDAEIELMKLAWSSFDRRRDFEWKVALGLWAALAAFIGIVLTGDIEDNIWVPVVATIAAFIIVVLHFNWCRGLGKANNADRHLQYFYEDRLKTALGITMSKKVTDGFAALGKHMGRPLNWSYLLEWGVTVVLCLGAAGAVWAGHYADDADADTTQQSASPTPSATTTATDTP